MHIRKLGKNLGRRLKDFSYLCRGVYRSLDDVTGLDLHRLAIPLTQFTPSENRIILNWDFFPDWFSSSGDSFENSPQLEFARQCLANPSFDFKSTRYFRLIAKGRLPRR